MDTQELVKHHLTQAYHYYEEAEDFNKALYECDAVIELAPDLADVHNLRGVVLEELGRSQEALAAYRKTLQIDPTYEEAQQNLAELEAELGSPGTQEVKKNLGMEAELGDPIAEFSQVYTSCLGLFITGLVILGVFLVYQGIVVGSTSLGGMLFLLVLGVGALALALRGIIRSFRNRGLHVRVFTGGLIREVGGEGEIIVWEDIARVWQSVTSWRSYGAEVTRSYTYTLELNDKRRYEFYNLKDIQQMGQFIQEQITRRQLPVVREKLKAGESVSFGKLSIQAEGLSKGENLLAWDEIKQVEVAKGEVTIHRRRGAQSERWLSMKASKIPNIFIFLALVRENQGSA